MSDNVDQLSEPVVRALLEKLADAYNCVAPECKCDFWQSIAAMCDTIITGQVGGQLIVSVDFSSRVSATERGVKVEPMRLANVRLNLRSAYAPLVAEQEKFFESAKKD